MLPTPALPIVALPGLAFSQATSSFRLFAGSAFFPEMMNGAIDSSEIGSRSVSRSYVSLE
jgi:hypothetical protein